jgi:hypothetical protein
MLDLTSVGIPVFIVIGLAMVMVIFLRRRTKPRSNARPQEEKSQCEEIGSPDLKQADGETSGQEPNPGNAGTHSVDEIEKAREELRALDLQKQITAAALTTIFEAEIQGKISLGTRDGLVENYKAQMKALDEQIAERKKITELSDLARERENLIRSSEQRIAEIDERLKQINALPESFPQISTVAQAPLGSEEASEIHRTNSDNASFKEDKPAVEVKNRAEDRMKAIREEVLKAIERLEKIESEG